MISGLKERFPDVHIQAFTAVELEYLSEIAKMSLEDTLVELRDAGLGSIPGGGAEIFADRARSIICDHKVSGNRWLEIAEKVHQS